METIAQPEKAPLGREPKLVGVDYVELSYVNDQQRYRTEAWRLTNGDCVVIVSSNGGTSLVNASEKIAEAVDQRWYTSGSPIQIIEDWHPDGTLLGDRFMYSSRTGGHLSVDLDELDARGLPLPR